jgi:hypothetical protein
MLPDTVSIEHRDISRSKLEELTCREVIADHEIARGRIRFTIPTAAVGSRTSNGRCVCPHQLSEMAIVFEVATRIGLTIVGKLGLLAVPHVDRIADTETIATPKVLAVRTAVNISGIEISDQL